LFPSLSFESRWGDDDSHQRCRSRGLRCLRSDPPSRAQSKTRAAPRDGCSRPVRPSKNHRYRKPPKSPAAGYWNMAGQRYYRPQASMLLRLARLCQPPRTPAENPGFSTQEGKFRRESDSLLGEPDSNPRSLGYREHRRVWRARRDPRRRSRSRDGKRGGLDGEIAVPDYRGVPHIEDRRTLSPRPGRRENNDRAVRTPRWRLLEAR
jgi:hypothetical protein